VYLFRVQACCLAYLVTVCTLHAQVLYRACFTIFLTEKGEDEQGGKVAAGQGLVVLLDGDQEGEGRTVCTAILATRDP
jgi:hypothetical protein